MIARALGLALASAALWPASLAAQEAWVGVAAHGVDTPLTFDTGEGGVDLQAGYRFAPERALAVIGSPAPYVFALVNSDGDTSLIAAGLSWKRGERLYARPGIGVAVHDGPSLRVRAGDDLRTDLGSRLLFEPELALGWQATPRLGIEASWVHVSHAQLFSGQNPGLDVIGARLVVKL
ncbi:acyloxyacyl hydrolase [Sphingomonas gilva]|uniref:Acyloxyacyl hydrolase n=1 Tax=Sphingomonas gilva TaxID=2305907 RepID=A0A396RLV1_9SPHN|nr:acyloxyacyl hydrolase [Sphingomonas gilva]RHW17367.1 acyloxyacyl hydrolase [Sphingomonas gilva]